MVILVKTIIVNDFLVFVSSMIWLVNYTKMINFPMVHKPTLCCFNINIQIFFKFYRKILTVKYHLWNICSRNKGSFVNIWALLLFICTHRDGAQERQRWAVASYDKFSPPPKYFGSWKSTFAQAKRISQQPMSKNKRRDFFFYWNWPPASWFVSHVLWPIIRQSLCMFKVKLKIH